MENNNAKGYSIAALVCGILGIVGSFIPWVCYFTFVLAILGIVFGVKGRKLAPRKSIFQDITQVIVIKQTIEHDF